MKILRLSDVPLTEAVREAASVLARGGVVLYPTDTLYGLAVDAHNPSAISRLRALKGREAKKPLSVVIVSHQALGEYAVVDTVAKGLAERYFPGALTLVLPAQPHVPKEIQLLDTIGVRVPDHTFSRELARAFGRAYTATSANRSGYPTQKAVTKILYDFGPLISEIDLVVDDGDCTGGTGSTVVRVQGGVAHLLREGKISRGELGL